ncbi:isoleucine--tRNA ligase [Chloroflexota bacterium]
MFQPVNSRVNFSEVEEAILGWWQSKGIFEQSVESRRGGQRFVLYEGPPTANGSPGIHHVLARVFKDVIPRYKAMKGYYTPRNAGWDTHGLPVELEVEKELGFSGKMQIEEYGIDRFNARCKESVFRYLKEWETMTRRIGFWIDLEHPYITMKNEYMESVWWAIKQMWDKGLVYQGYKVTPHCPRCGTSLSSHEVALGYQDDTEDPSVYIKFKVVPSPLSESEQQKRLYELSREKLTYLLAWTTTPWTLPGNTALAVAADAEYAVVVVGDEYLIMAAQLVSVVGLDDCKVVAKVVGKDLVEVHYEPLYKFDIRYAKGEKKAYRVIEGDFVSMEDGTGIVHIAPAYGEIDFEVGNKESLPLVHTVELNGMVTTNLVTGFTPKAWEYIQRSEVPVTFGPARLKLDLPGAGKFVKDADKDVLADLEKRGLLFRSETIRHTYPFCWRCDTPLLYYAKQTWYIRTTAVKEELIAGNSEINWYPEHIKYGRFGDWLNNNVDWAFSRERYWGTPLPVWRCESCGDCECVGSVEELKGKTGFSGLKEPLDLHRPFVDEVYYNCSKCGQRMERVPEVIDCWFDSGAMPVAQGHYPFENKELFDEELKQADYICEAVDQTRGWFYSLHAISTLLFNRSCFKNVICLGHILDASGEKMSKTKGNVVEPWSVIDKYGADALRWYLFTSVSVGNAYRFNEDRVAEVSRRFLSTLWNVYSFFILYANIDNFTPVNGESASSPSELDRWLTSELNQLVVDVDSALDTYNPTEAGRKVEIFVDYLSNWYVRRSRRRFWKSENDADKLSAYNTLYQCLVTLSRLMAPLTPFIAEELYRNLVGSVSPEAPESVHLTDFPVADKTTIDKQLMDDTRLVMKVSSLGRAVRSQAGIKVRQPLQKLLVRVSSGSQEKGLKSLASQVLEEVNVKEISIIDDMPVTEWPVTTEGDLTLMLDTDITPELAAEGMAREIVHRLQTMRRSAGFDIADHIVTYYQGDAYVAQVMTDFADYIKQETLSQRLVDGVAEEGVFTESYKLSGHEVLLGVQKLA